MGVWDRVKSWFGASPPDEPSPEPAPTPQPIARDRELEAAIAADPDATAPYLVYADWLQERGDPRGELIALQIAIEETSSGEQLAELRAREAALLAEQLWYLVGPLREPVRWRRGFVHRIDVDGEVDVDRLVATLAVEHPATRFLAQIGVSGELPGLVERIRERAPEGCTVVAAATSDVAQLDAEVELVEDRGELLAGVRLASQLDGAQWGYRTLARTTVTSEHGARTWWCGGVADPWRTRADRAPFTGRYAIPRYAGGAAVEVAVRFRLVDAEAPAHALWFQGRIEVAAGTRRCPLVLRACEPLPGFEPIEVSTATRATGPMLLEDADPESNFLGAALPDVGVFVQWSDELVTPDARTPVLGFQPPQDVRPHDSFGGSGGALAHVHRPTDGYGDVLTLVRLPGGSPRHVEQLGQLRAGAFDPTGRELAVVSVGPKLLVLYDLDTARELLALPLEELNAEAPVTVLWSEGVVHVAGDGRTWQLDREARRVIPGRIPRALTHGDVRADEVTSYHPKPQRTAWLMPGERSEDGSTLLIGWCDRDGVPASLLLPDDGLANLSRSGFLAVLDDGRLLAIGSRIWIIEPASSTVLDLGAAGDYTTQPVITRHGDTLRLWSHGGGPWWIEL